SGRWDVLRVRRKWLEPERHESPRGFQRILQESPNEGRWERQRARISKLRVPWRFEDLHPRTRTPPRGDRDKPGIASVRPAERDSDVVARRPRSATQRGNGQGRRANGGRLTRTREVRHVGRTCR